jgi:hypothetical protein
MHLPISDVGLNKTKHLQGGLGGLDKDTVVDLQQTQQLQNLAGFGGDLIDTTDTDNKVNLGLGGDIEVTSGPCSTLETNFLLLLVDVLLYIRFGTFEDDLALSLGCLRKIDVRNSSSSELWIRSRGFSPERWLI